MAGTLHSDFRTSGCRYGPISDITGRALSGQGPYRRMFELLSRGNYSGTLTDLNDGCFDCGWSYGDYSVVVRPARTALCLLQRWKRVVDRSHRREPSLLRLGFRSEHHRRWSVEQSRDSLAIARGVLHNHSGRGRLLCFAPLLPVSVVKPIAQRSETEKATTAFRAVPP